MGWSSGTDLFDGALDVFLKYVPEEEKPLAVEQWYNKFEYTDWDTEAESDYYVDYILGIQLASGWLSQEEYDELQREIRDS